VHPCVLVPRKGLAWALAILACTSACTSNESYLRREVAPLAQIELRCPQEQIQTRCLEPSLCHRAEATGCSRTARYRYDPNLGWALSRANLDEPMPGQVGLGNAPRYLPSIMGDALLIDVVQWRQSQESAENSLRRMGCEMKRQKDEVLGIVHHRKSRLDLGISEAVSYTYQDGRMLGVQRTWTHLMSFDGPHVVRGGFSKLIEAYQTRLGPPQEDTGVKRTLEGQQEAPDDAAYMRWDARGSSPSVSLTILKVSGVFSVSEVCRREPAKDPTAPLPQR
jgi:hypothetical protein